jgi:hypothetical protein
MTPEGAMNKSHDFLEKSLIKLVQNYRSFNYKAEDIKNIMLK